MKLYQVDAFTDTAFAGNPAAVCVLSSPREPEWMQKVAREMNLSETAFLRARDDGYDLRWFTPTVEVDLCGHATLASAHVLWEEGYLPKETSARFHSRSGLLGAERSGEWIELDFPAEPGLVLDAEREAPPGLLEALPRVDVRRIARNRLDLLVEVGSEDEVRSLRPDISRIAEIDVRGVIVTAAAADPGPAARGAAAGYDFVSRYFAPACGVAEDPVTGSTHCFLGPWWCERLGKEELTGFQASERGGRVRVRPRGDRVRLGGQAVLVFRGELC